MLKNNFITKKTESMVLRANLDPEITSWIKTFKGKGEKCNVTSKALEFYYDYCNYRKGFLIRIIEPNFELCKLILRKIGRNLKSYR